MHIKKLMLSVNNIYACSEPPTHSNNYWKFFFHFCQVVTFVNCQLSAHHKDAALL